MFDPKSMFFCFALMFAAHTGCTDTDFSGPFRGEVLVRTSQGTFELATVDLPDLTSLDPLQDPVMRFSNHPKIVEDDLLEATPDRFARTSDYSPRVRNENGVAVARDLESLLVLSAYHGFKENFALAADMFGTIDDLVPASGFQILIEPKFSSEFGTVEIGTNAAYVNGGQSFLLVQMSSLEDVPLGMNPSVLAHEFGHHVFHVTYAKSEGVCDPDAPGNGPVPPGVFASDDVFRGFNEGFADFIAFALQGETNPLGASIPGPASGERLIDSREDNYTPFTWNSYVGECDGRFYCIGTLWARAVFETYLATGASPSDPSARALFAREVISSIIDIPTRIRTNSTWSPSSFPCAVNADSENLVRAYVNAFIAGLPDGLIPFACSEFSEQFDYTPGSC